MSEDISMYIKVGVTVTLTAMMIAITLNILVPAKGYLDQYINRTNSTFSNAPVRQLEQMNGGDWPAPSLYSLLLQCEGSVERIELYMIIGRDPSTGDPVYSDPTSDNTFLYDAVSNPSEFALDRLVKEFAGKTVTVTVTDSGTAYNVTVREVDE